MRNGRSHNEGLAENLNVEFNKSMAMSGERVHLLTAINPGSACTEARCQPLQGSQNPDREHPPALSFSDLASYLVGSSTSRCALADSTAFALNGKVKVVPPYHAFH